MIPEHVEEQVIQFIHQHPFVPFVVEMTDGTTIEVSHPRLAINGDGAVFFGPDGGLVDIEFEQVLGLRLLSAEAVS